MFNKCIENLKIIMNSIKLKAKQLKKELGALYIASKRRDVPWYAKLVILLVVGYALSPIDLIPDFIPVFGYLDDIILLPIGIAFAIKLIPINILQECREESENIFKDGKPKNWVAFSIIIFIWISILTYLLLKFL